MVNLLCSGIESVDSAIVVVCYFFFKQKTAYEMRISDWSSDVCSSDLVYAAVKFFLYTFLGSIFMLAGLIYLYIKGGSFQLDDLYALKQIGRASCRERVCQYV